VDAIRAPQTEDEARAFLLERIDFERRPAPSGDVFRLDGITHLLAALGNPHETIPVVHVAGTKGKGSTSAMIAAGLTAQGLRTGLYTSPHVRRIEERFRIDDRLPSTERFVELTAELARVERSLAERPTYFELVTALAWLHFAAERVDVAVLEVGVGGRLDSTNVCRPVVTVITNIGRDHERLLGDTPAKIAAEKAGIVKRGVPCVGGVLEPSAREVVRAVCEERGAALWEWTAEITAETTTGPEFPPRCVTAIRTPLAEWPPLRVPLVGTHQAANAALAVAALDRLAERGWAIDRERAVRGIEGLRWPLRFEVLRREPFVVCDAAHNTSSIEALVRTLEHDPDGDRRRWLVFAAARDKDYAAMLEQLVPVFGEIVVTRFVGNPRAVDPGELARVVRSIDGSRPVTVTANPAEAWQVVAKRAGPADLVCATGSFFLAAEMQALLGG
jgi:dihydrofolate synthase / folylpolyglutamate synthase